MLTYNQFMRRLEKLGKKEIVALAHSAEISEHTLIKVWRRDTKNPGILLVERVTPFLVKVAA